jgi:membrane-bound serine protease (ClpP class)
LAVAGAVSFVLGALMLFDPAGDAYQVSLPVAIAIAGVLALFIGFAIAKVIAVRKTRPRTGGEELAGQVGTVREQLDPEGLVFVHGELWRARSTTGDPIPAGASVKVETLSEGLVLEVSRAEEPAVVV